MSRNKKQEASLKDGSLDPICEIMNYCKRVAMDGRDPVMTRNWWKRKENFEHISFGQQVSDKEIFSPGLVRSTDTLLLFNEANVCVRIPILLAYVTLLPMTFLGSNELDLENSSTKSMSLKGSKFQSKARKYIILLSPEFSSSKYIKDLPPVQPING